jgi:putative PIN family toxin of toxin-antitoxin system
VTWQRPQSSYCTAVSAALRPDSSSGDALVAALAHADVVVSDETWSELQEVLHRARFDRYFRPAARRTDFLHALARSIRWCHVVSQVVDSRDPKDNKFLALALDAGAAMIVSGDSDLTTLNPWRGVAILTPGAFLQHCLGPDSAA